MFGRDNDWGYWTLVNGIYEICSPVPTSFNIRLQYVYLYSVWRLWWTVVVEQEWVVVLDFIATTGSFAQCTIFWWRTWHDNYVTSSKVCSSLRTYQKKRQAIIDFSILVRQPVSDFDQNFSGFMTLKTTKQGLHAGLLHHTGLYMKLTVRQSKLTQFQIPYLFCSVHCQLMTLSTSDDTHTKLKIFVTYGRSLLKSNMEFIRLMQKGIIQPRIHTIKIRRNESLHKELIRLMSQGIIQPRIHTIKIRRHESLHMELIILILQVRLIMQPRIHTIKIIMCLFKKQVITYGNDTFDTERNHTTHYCQFGPSALESFQLTNSCFWHNTSLYQTAWIRAQFTWIPAQTAWISAQQIQFKCIRVTNSHGLVINEPKSGYNGLTTGTSVRWKL